MDAPVWSAQARRAQRRFNFRRMMAIVINDRDAFFFAFKLKAAIRAGKFPERMRDRVERHIQFQPDSDRRQRVVNVVLARHVKRDFA